MPRSEHQSLTHPLRLLCVLAVLLVPLFGLLSAGTAHAATTVRISDGASCEAAGGTWTDRCTIGDFTVAADTTVQITVDTNFSSLTNYGTVTISARSGTNSITNAAGAMLNIDGAFGLYAASSNAGTITIKSGSMGVVAPLTNTSTGQITIQNGAGLFLLNVLTNQGTITTICDGYVYYGSGSLTGNPVQTSCPSSDTSAPVITPSISGTRGNNDWYTSDVSVSWTVTDDESAVSDKTGCDTATITNDTSGTTITCSATSAGGTTSQNVTIKRDATAPTISAAATTNSNAAGWYSSDVTVAFTCADALSGIPQGACPADQTLTGEGNSISSTAQTVSDAAGNMSALSNVVTVQIDRTAPSVSVTGVANGAVYTLGSVPAAGCSTADALSGIATPATLSLSGSGVGSFTATCAGATDAAGNSAPAVSVSYSVAYVFSGFLDPVDNPPVVNTATAGRSIPLKWRLTDANGNPITNLTSVTVTSAAGGCSASTPTDQVEAYAAGASGLQNLGNGYYQYNWSTQKSWAGSCRTLRLDLGDGQVRTALFQFR